MPTLTSLTKWAFLATFAVGVLASPQSQIIIQDIESPNPWNTIEKTFDTVKDTVKDMLDDTRNRVEGWLDINRKYIDGFTQFSHPAFPEYSMRYKQPSLCDPDVKQISGYLDVGKDKHFFFWFFESRSNPSKDPLVLWLNGGPGCSSLTGLFMELGPCSVNLAGNDTTYNKYSWNSNANIIFLDQPVNVGYSYGSASVSNTEDAAKDVNAFLQLFIREFTQYSELDFHISGESYAGHYIPAIATAIHKQNKGSYTTNVMQRYTSTIGTIHLKSLLIGNGLTDPLVQYKYYSKMACESNYGLILDASTCKNMESKYPACAKLIERCYHSPGRFTCIPAAMKCDRDQVQPFLKTDKNIYDVREKCETGGTCYKIVQSVQKYLNLEHVKEAVGAKTKGYESCDMSINFRFQMSGDYMRPYVNMVAPLLEDNIKILIYAGDADYICNWMGNKAWTIELPWSGQNEFASAKDKEWVSEITGQTAGELRSTQDGRLAFLRVFNAGHMVPYDQPEHSLEMLNNWISGRL
ncbi:Alpha/Beta hydrolase protein [Spinellus fusiger]|nr:Alpha/Beta hydrolase protein [Spinellus fusiger]